MLNSVIEAIYLFFNRRSRLLLTGYVCFALLSVACLALIDQRENIKSLLPDNSADIQVRRNFDWLQKAPFARKLLIDLHAVEGISAIELQQAAAALSGSLQPPLFTQVLSGPPLEAQGQLFTTLLQALPNLVTTHDLQLIEERLRPEKIKQRLQRVREQLLTPQGWWTKQSLREDPLALWQIAAGHLRQLNPMAQADQQQRDFVSRDGRHRLVVVDTDIAIGDVIGGGKLIDQLQQMIALHVPAGIQATVVSGHQYTLANASTIQRDLRIVLGTATLAILLIFILLLRSWHALFVFLLPASVLGVSAAAVAVVFPSVSGITIGFGAVLLGITVDFTLHVYFSLRGSSQPTMQLRRLTSPLIGGALTSFLAFSVLLSSSLPGQRQLAVFSMTAIATATVLALVVMPQLCGKGCAASDPPLICVKRVRLWIVVFWAAMMVLSAVAVPNLRFDGDMRSLGVSTPALRDGEQLLQQVWGNMRSSALLFARGKTLDEALTVNDTIYQQVQRQSSSIVSLASILPAPQRQQHNRELWNQFWQQHQPTLAAHLLSIGADLGFSSSAFHPFSRWLQQPIEPVGLHFWQQASLTEVISGLMMADSEMTADGVALISLMDEADLTPQLQHSLASVPNAIVIAPGGFSQQLSAALATDFSRFIVMSLGVVVMVLIVWYRRLRHILLALLPVASGLLFMFGAMGWLGLSFNLFNVIAAILIIGLGVDYGIFILSRCDGSGCEQAQRAVLVSALTTLAGFGSLVLARHPAMYSIGITVLFGISAAVVTALYIVPAVYQWTESR
ncbi:MAG: MMPL family transporter [Thermodesulfobacteriota bacterium]|nr:MMPL family transporter [Thermodesulfobacteriota bacterium]